MGKMTEAEARGIALVNGIELSPNLSQAKQEAAEWMTMKDIDGQLYMALYAIVHLPDSSYVTKTVNDIHREAAQNGGVRHTKPIRKSS